MKYKIFKQTVELIINSKLRNYIKKQIDQQFSLREGLPNSVCKATRQHIIDNFILRKEKKSC